MSEIESIVIAVDGESKCGKTTIIEAIAEEAELQQSVIPSLLEDGTLETWELPEATLLDLKTKLGELHTQHAFNEITTVSAGNAFRAAALYNALLGLQGVEKTTFDEADTELLRDILETPDIVDVLQNDPNVSTQVSVVAQCIGVQALCGAIFSDEVMRAYQADGGGNLVVVDARDPIGHLKRNNVIGPAAHQITARNVISLYIDTPSDIAATRLSGDFAENLAIVERRRELDATREELPVIRPETLIDTYDRWLLATSQADTADSIAPPYMFNNGKHASLDDIRFFAGIVASLAHDRSIRIPVQTLQYTQQAAGTAALAY